MFSSRSQTHYSLVVSQTTALIAHLVFLKGCEILYVNGCGHNDQGQGEDKAKGGQGCKEISPQIY